MESLLSLQQRAHGWSRWTAYLTTILLVASAYAVSRWLWPSMQVYPFFLFFPVLIGAGVLFDHGAGYLATLLSTLTVALLLLPADRAWGGRSRDLLAVGTFLSVGLLLTALLQLLHRSLRVARDALRRVQAAEEQKELSLREAVHRFKNDTATVVALLRSQARQLADAQAKAALANTANRVLVMARVHERLRVSSTADALVNAQEFIATLCEDLKTALLDLRPVTIAVEAEAHDLSHQRAVAIGLIVNEALTNALKYAFPDDRAGLVSVMFRREADWFRLEVKDDGVGFDPERAPTEGGLGRRLMQSMAGQIGGTLTIMPDESASGTIVTVSFPVARPRA
ncbi:sensor histidine kinase [Methylobacterium sp. P31]